jgi:hypothetical protein
VCEVTWTIANEAGAKKKRRFSRPFSWEGSFFFARFNAYKGPAAWLSLTCVGHDAGPGASCAKLVVGGLVLDFMLDSFQDVAQYQSGLDTRFHVCVCKLAAASALNVGGERPDNGRNRPLSLAVSLLWPAPLSHLHQVLPCHKPPSKPFETGIYTP